MKKGQKKKTDIDIQYVYSYVLDSDKKDPPPKKDNVCLRSYRPTPSENGQDLRLIHLPHLLVLLHRAHRILPVNRLG